MRNRICQQKYLWFSAAVPADGEPERKTATVMKKFTIEMENGGIMEGELYPEIAPITCANFEELANSGFYDGLIFHRVIPHFMIQGGDPEGTGMGGSEKKIPGEFASNGFRNDLKHTRGVISMARSMMPNSASSQFFITKKNLTSLVQNSLTTIMS